MTKGQSQYSRKRLFQTNDARIIGYLSMCRINLDTDLMPFVKINSKWITDLTAKHKTNFIFILIYSIIVVPIFPLALFCSAHPTPLLPQSVATALSLSVGHSYMFFD